MKPKERRRAIAECLDREGACGYAQLAALLRVSPMTIRRNIDALSRSGSIIKTLRGAQRLTEPAHLYETNLRSRLIARRTEKCAIAREAIKLVSGRQSVFLDGSTTCLELAKVLASDRRGLTIVTNSSLVCIESGKGKDNMTVGFGGNYDAATASFAGPTAEENASRYFVNLVFVSTQALIADQGAFGSSIASFQIKRIMAKQGAMVVLLADYSKFGQRALSKVLDISEIHTVVTDAKAPQVDIEVLRRAGRRVLVAHHETHRAACEQPTTLEASRA